MSFREEDRRNKNCPNRGLGIAAAVGVGAALYYIFSKRSENPEENGATSSWSAEEHALHYSSPSRHDSSSSWHGSSSWHESSSSSPRYESSTFTMVSEHSTSDTSINSSSSEDVPDHFARRVFNQSDMESDPAYSNTNDDSYDSDNSDQQTSDEDTSMSDDIYRDFMLRSEHSSQSDDETNTEFDVTRSSIDVPTDQRSDQRSRTPMMRQFGELTVRLRNQVVNRERSWSLEQCSICFDMMQKEQEVLSLACTHRFHQTCILPWLEQQQTCPVCRKSF